MELKETEYIKVFKAGPLMCDYNLKLFPAEFFRTLQITADEHAEALGFGGYTMAERGLAWVVIRTELHIDRYPRYMEDFAVYTATGEARHGVYPRYFEIRDCEGNVMATAISLWIVFSLEKRAMLSETESGIRVEAARSRKEIPPFPPVPKPLQEGSTSISERVVKYTDLDMVGHMNNTHYIDWMTDAVPWAVFREREFTRILIGYNGETKPDTKLKLELCENGDDISFRDISDGTSHFVVNASWKRL